MPIDASIPLQVRGLQLPDPIQSYGRELGLRNALMENQQGQMQLAAQQQDQQQAEQLRALLSDPNFNMNDPQQRMGLAKYGKRGLEIGKAFDEQKTAHLTQVKEIHGLLKSTAAFIMANPALGAQAIAKLGEHIGEDMTDEIKEYSALPNDEAKRQWAAGHAVEADKMLPEGGSVSLGDKTVFTNRDKLTGQVTPVGSMVEGMKPGEQQRLDQGERRLAALEERGMGAPSLTEIVDPTDPKYMLRIDAKTYRGGGLGSPGVVGRSGKEPVAAGKELQTQEGKSSVDTQVASLRDLYTQLQKNGGITDTTKSAMGNVSAGAGSSGVGQAAGRLFGTQNQSLRNQIAQSRPLLLQAIKNATGMSAKQMDSNVELKMYLAAATDPTLDVQANLAALDNLSKLYGLGGAAPAAPAAPNGVKFLGFE